MRYRRSGARGEATTTNNAILRLLLLTTAAYNYNNNDDDDEATETGVMAAGIDLCDIGEAVQEVKVPLLTMLYYVYYYCC